ncbi:hypothetical protein ACRDNQ_00170 [Palleronia sp. KMU-117]|uniref:hypothetical protein n=1 Tax=Palleronia sp. KMU-117 TaxID=3434108 RepID=UPI003D71D51A
MTPGGLAAFGALGPAEVTLIDGLGNGMLDTLGTSGLPEAGDDSRRVRADLIRFLLLGGPDAPRMHEKGLRLGGAWIVGTLDLEGCRVPRDIGLLDCRFDATPVLLSAIIDTLAFDGSDLPGLTANRLDARGDLLFRAATIRGRIELRGARIGGDMILDGARLDSPGDRALQAERISVRGGALFRGASVRGGIALPGGRIGGNLDLIGATIESPEGLAIEADSVQVDGDVTLRLARVTGAVSLVTARIGGDVDLSEATLGASQEVTVDLGRTTVAGAFFLRQGAKVTGTLSLNGATLGAIVDDPESWPAKGDLRLNRCLYGAILGGTVDARARLDWLARQTPERWNEDFWPQPYEQLASVLGAMGHDEDKRRVLIEKERLSRRARRHRAGCLPTRLMLRLNDGLMGMTTGYGRLPLLALVWIFALWGAGAAFYAHLDRTSALRPNAPVVLRAPEWVLCATPRTDSAFLPSLGAERAGLADPGEAQLVCFRRQPEASAYPAFNAAMLSADAIIPGLASGQSTYWSPDTRTPAGYVGKWFMYVQSIAGIALGLLAVAGFSGMVKSN